MKKTTKKISAAALALIMGATAFTGCSGSTNSTPGGTDSAASTSGGAATGSQKIMSSNENVKSAVDNVSVAEDYKNIKVDTKLKFMAWYDIQEASPAVELFKTLYGTPKNKPEGYESVADENVFVNVKFPTTTTDTLILQSWFSRMNHPIHSLLKHPTILTEFIRTFSRQSTVLLIPILRIGLIISRS